MRGKVSKITMFMLVLCMAISMFSVNAFAADETTPIDSCDRIVEAYDLDDAEDFINDGKNSTYPTCKTEGYLFAGWYTKETCTEDSYWGHEEAGEPGDTVYALFVPSHVLSVKAQISSNLLDKDPNDDTTASIRFVTTVDSLYYRQAGFEVSYIGKDGSKKSVPSASNKVYKKLYAIGSTTDEYTEKDVLKYTPQGTFCKLSTYFKACTVKNISSDYFTTAFTVKPYVITMDGSKVYGDTVVKSINDYFLAQDVWVSSTDSNAADTVENGSEDKPFQTLNYALGMVKNDGTIHVKDSYKAPSNFVWKDHDKTVNITGGTMDFTAVPTIAIKEVDTPVLQINDAVTFTNTALKFVDGQHIYANGNKVEIASDVTWGNTSAYVWIYGGAYKTALKSDTNLVLGAGKYARVFGGGNYNDVTGDVNVTISGTDKVTINEGINYQNHTLTYAAFGGGENGSDIIGDINFTIANEYVLFDYVYGGGYGSKVTGDITVNFSGKAMSVYGGGRNGSVTGDTRLIMSGANAWVQQLFGGCQGASMTGNTNVDVQDGTVVRRVYGGCYNDYKNYGNILFQDFDWVADREENKGPYVVSGHTNVSISPKATLSLDFTDTGVRVDNSIYAISRYKEIMAGEWGAFIFNADSYTSTYKSKLGYNDSTYDEAFSSQSYHYLITTNGNTADGSLGTVSSAGDYIRINPKSGYSATVTVDGEKTYYTESTGVFKLPTLTNKTDTCNMVVTFGTIDPSVDKSGYEAKIDGAYYDTLEEAMDAAKVLESEDVVVISLLKDAEVEETMTIDGDTNLEVEGVDKYTINRADALINGNIFNVKDGSTLTVDNVVLDGRTSSQIAAGTTDLAALTGGTASLINTAGTVDVNNVTIQYAVKTEGYGAAIYGENVATTSILVEDSEFNYNKAANQGGAICAYSGSSYLEIKNSQFDHNESATNGGAVSVHTDTANIENCIFTNNTSATNGGAVYSASGVVVTMINSTGDASKALFSNNTSMNGGASAMSSGKQVFKGYTFQNNTALMSDDSKEGQGGAIFCGGGSTVKAVNCMFGGIDTKDTETTEDDVNYGNTAGLYGGAIYVANKGQIILKVADEYSDYAALCEGNHAGVAGGAVRVGTGTLDVNGYTFNKNTATSEGGALQFSNDNAIEVDVCNSIFTENSSKKGGAIFSNINSTATAKLTIQDSMFESNEATDTAGGAIFLQGGMHLALVETDTEDVPEAIFKDNTASTDGGAICKSNNGTSAGTVEITGYTFDHNIATTGNGGAFYTNTKNDVISSFSNTTFICNDAVAGQGGAICNYNSTVELTDCIVGKTDQGNTAKGNGGAIYNGGSGTVKLETDGGTASFEANSSDTGYGGAVGIGTGKLYSTGYTFKNNTAATTGGAIYVTGAENSAHVVSSIFEDNKVTGTGTVGGAIHSKGAVVTIVNSKFTKNEAVTNGGAIANTNSGKLTISATSEELGVTEATLATFEGNASNNTASGFGGGAIYFGSGTFSVAGYAFNDNTSEGDAGALCLRDVSTVTDCTFDGNDAGMTGGALYCHGNATITGSTFTNNTAVGTTETVTNEDETTTTTITGGGGAIHNTAENTVINTSTFSGNSSRQQGGAIFNTNKVTISDSSFTSNEATKNAGALMNFAGSTAIVTDTSFATNESPNQGGAIYNNGATLTLTGTKETALFDGNKTTGSGVYGGAIYNDGTLNATKYIFTNNYAPGRGGAISNYGKNPMITDCKFVGNYAGGNGGAVYSGGGVTINLVASGTSDLAVFDGNYATGGTGGGAISAGSGTLKVTGYKFINNYAKLGGAIYNSGGVTATFTGIESNTVESMFKDNYSTSGGGGAIYVPSGTLTVSDYVFDSNESKTAGGAIYRETATVTINDSKFTENTATTEGGVFYGQKAGGDVQFIGTDATQAVIQNNKANNGGAIHIVGAGTLTVSGYTFDTNKALTGQGGAIYRDTTTLDITDTKFVSNEAKAEGGAICGVGNGTVQLTETDATKTIMQGNTATKSGGAVYVNGSGTLTVSGYTFDTNETLNGQGGAIYRNVTALDITNAKFSGNTAKTDGGAIYGAGGGEVKLTGTDATKAIVENNSATSGAGGAIRIGTGTLSIDGYKFTGNHATNGGAIQHNNQSSAVINNSEFSGNYATTNGGAISTRASHMQVSETNFTDNYTVDGNGGAIYLARNTLTLTSASGNAVFSGNKAQGTDGVGGAIYATPESGATCTLNGSGYEFNTNSSTTYGGAIYADAATLSMTGTSFTENESTYGGAIHSYASMVTATSCAFTSNKSVNAESQDNGLGKGGGALNIVGNSDVTLNTADDVAGTFTSNNTNHWGGAIYVTDSKLSVDGYTFDQNTAKHAAAILFDNATELISEAVADDETTTDVDESAPAEYDELCTEVITINNSVFTSNTADNAGGAMYLNARTVKFTDCSFTRNGTTGTLKTGGVIHIASGEAEFVGNSPDKAIFQNNTTGSHGGAINNDGGTLKVSGYQFIGNTTTGYTDDSTNGFGGAINNSKTAIVTDCMFDGNTATGKGGAIYNGSGASLTITVSESPKIESVFKNNSSEVWGGAIGLGSGTMNIYGYQFLNNSAVYGGAISRQSNTLVTIQDSEHSLVDAVFKGNTATCAGAIYTTNGTTEITDYTFENNSATEGGAIYANGGTVKPTDCKFGGDEAALGNKATTKNGGAIYITNGSTVTLTSDDNASMAIFKNNEATLIGGAVYISKGTLNVTGYTFDSNKANNTASNDGGGAIFNANNGSNKMVLTNSVFNNNYAAKLGGAICTHGPNPQITNCKFTDNTAGGNGGAIYGGGSKVVTITGGNAEMAIFSGNKSTGGNGGAIGIGSGQLVLENYKFESNTAAKGQGGAIYVTGSGTSYTTITGCEFVSNSAKEAGALHVGNSGKVNVYTSKFTTNSATTNGGAVSSNGGGAYNIYTSTFTTNSATTNGGAIYANSTGAILVEGSTFTGNTATAGSAIRTSGTGTTLTGCTLSKSGISGTYTDGGGNTITEE